MAGTTTGSSPVAVADPAMTAEVGPTVLRRRELAAVGEGMDDLGRRRGVYQLVDIPLALALLLRLDLEQVGRELAASIGADAPGAESIVIRRDRLQFGNGRAAALLGLCRTHLLHRFQVVQRDGIRAGVRLVRIVRRLGQQPLGEGPR